MGWQVDEATMSIKQDSVSSLQVMNADNMTYPPEATSLAYVSGILDKNDTNVTSTSGKTISLIQLNKWNVVDVGSPYTLTNINAGSGKKTFSVTIMLLKIVD